MSEEIRVSRPAAPQATMPMESSSSGNSKMPWIVLVVVVLVLLVVGALFREKLFGKKADTMATAKSGTYQAVFLTNGQVYFGKISEVHGDYVGLSDIYYLQVVQQPIQGTPAAEQQQ